MNVLNARLTHSFFAVAVAVAVIAVALLGHTPSAKAASVGFCNVNLNGGTYCESGRAQMYRDYGYGELGSVCVRIAVTGSACSGGPNQGVYSPQAAQDFETIAYISNHREAPQIVHGVYFN